MAKWHFEERMVSLGVRRFPLLLMVGDNGVEVRMDFTRGWFIHYHSADLNARFSAFRDPLLGGDFNMVLGPRCTIGMDLSRLSRPLELEDCEPLAMNLKEILRMHLQIPGAVPPKIEQVHFLSPQLQPFDDY